MPYKPFLVGAIAAAMLATPGWADGPKGPKAKGPFKISPDTVYFNKTGNETRLVRTVELRQVGPRSEAIPFTAAAATDSGAWLTVAPGSGTLREELELALTATPGTLGPGVYTGKVTVTPAPGAGSPQTIDVVLRVLSGPGGASAAFVRPLSLDFHMVQGGANPEPRTLHVSSPTGGAGFAWTATRTIVTLPSATWLNIEQTAGTGPGQITVSVNGAGLAQGTYNAFITVASQSASAQVQVTLEVRASAPANLVIDPRAFNFIVHPGGPPVPAAKILRVKNTGSGKLNWKATWTGNWLSVTPTSGETPANITLSVNPSGLARGHYAGSVQVTAGTETKTARVFLRILGPPSPVPLPTSSTAAVQITPRAVEFCLCGGVLTPPSVAVQLTSRLTGLNFTAQATTASGSGWLSINPAAGSIPAAIVVTATPGSLATGLHTGTVSINVTGAVSEQHNVPVTLRVSPLAETARLVVRPGAIAFQAVQGGLSPANQQVALEARGAASIPYSLSTSTTTAVKWLSATPTGGTAPATITVSVNTSGLTAGVYLGAVVFQSAGTPAALPATLNVFLQILGSGNAAPLYARAAAAEPPGLLGFFLAPASEFMATAGVPQPVLVNLKSADGKALEGASVEVTPSTGDPSFTLEDAGGGLYTGMFQSLRAGPVSLAATAVAGSRTASFGLGGDLDGGPDTPVIFSGGVVSAANYAPAPTPLVPGALVSLYGWNLAESSAVATAVPLPRELAGVKVLVGGIAAPLISVTAGADFDQINFQVPLEVAALSYADIVVLAGGAFSAPEGVVLAPAVPALFTRNWQGTGAVAALHADFTEITPERPARPGETVLLYATALGEVSPAAVSGQAPAGLSRLVAPAQVLIAGRAARADFIGLAPGYPGLYQLNVAVPDGTSSGDAALEIVVDGIGSGAGVVLPIR